VGRFDRSLIANATGTALYVSQNYWKEQRITPKFSFHSTKYAALRPDVLGSSLPEKILKIIMAKRTWLSINLFFSDSKIPKWLNLALGYGAEGMLSGNSENTTILLLQIAKKQDSFI
jgi:hypothetical protein